MSSDEIVKILKKDGWYAIKQNGSHLQLKHDEKKGKVTVPMGRKDIPQRTKNAIWKQAGLK